MFDNLFLGLAKKKNTYGKVDAFNEPLSFYPQTRPNSSLFIFEYMAIRKRVYG